MLRYLAEHGIALGDRLEVIDRQPFGGPVFVRFGEREHPIGGELAHAMRIETEERSALTPLRPNPVPALEGAAEGASVALPGEVGGALVGPSALEQLLSKGRLRAMLLMLGPGVCRVDRLRRSGQLRHQHRRRRPVRLPAAVGRAAGERDGDADPVPLGQGGDRHRPQPARDRARALPPRRSRGACGCRPRSWRCRPTSPSSSAPRSG